MIRIRALNDEGNNSDDESKGTAASRKPTREVLEQEALELYNSTFELIATGKYDEAVDIIETILELPFLDEDDSKKCSPVQLQIKLGCLKSLSSIYYTWIPNPEKAVAVLTLALTLDPTNVPLWYRLGQVALKIVNFELAYYAFFQGYESNSNHWGCLEHLITLSYILYDPSTCLEYCALGLEKDPGFIRGLVFRDHIFRLQPSVKEDALTKWDVLLTDRTYTVEWEQKYLSELRELLRQQTEQAEDTWRKEQAQSAALFPCEHSLKKLTFSELCRVLISLYHEAKFERALLRPVELKCDLGSGDGTQSNPDTNSGLSNGMTTDVDHTHLSDNCVSDVTQGESESATGQGTENGLEKSGEESELNGDKEGDEDEPKESAKKKRRDVKWWQLEGKRRSQRVRGNLFSAAAASRPSKENDLAARLNSIIPKSILATVDSTEVEKELNTSSLSLSLTTSSVPPPPSGNAEVIDTYFGTDDERLDVEMFLIENSASNTMDLVLSLTRLLSKLSDRQWPKQLADSFVQIYALYRNHVPTPDPYSCNYFIQRTLASECGITLTMLELHRENLSIDKIKSDETFNSEIFSVSELCRVIDDPTILFRFHWFLANYHLTVGVKDHTLFMFSNARVYLEELEELLTTDLSYTIATRSENVICLVTVKDKLKVIQRSENVDRVNEIYEAKNYAELIEIIPFCTRLEGSNGMNLTNRFYLADSYYNLQRYTECQSECVLIMNSVKLPSNNQILHKTVLLLKRLLRVPDYKEIPLTLLHQTVRTMVSLMADHRLIIPVILPISPWCVLHALLVRLEEQDPSPYLDEESDLVPPSIQILQLAHEQLGRSGKCSLNKGKLLTYTLDSLLPLVSNELYADHEALKHCIEQTIYCLYGHPAKLTRLKYLCDHGNPNVKLELGRGRELYDYYRPESLPEFDSYTSISESDATLFLRILALVSPLDTKLEQGFEKLKEFLNGTTEEYRHEAEISFDPKLIDIFYLLGDHYFKIKEWSKSTEYYTWDLAVVPVRFDSWAGIALAKAERITTLLNSCDNYEIMEVMAVANVCAKCFQNAIQLNPASSKLTIEFGSFLYSMHSFCARLLKQSADQLSMEHFELIEAKKEEFLRRASRCFEPMAKNGTEIEIEEQWINHYMLGKVNEKLDPHGPEVFLGHYETAAKLLHQHGAAYPVKINYYSPQELAIEVLEIYYRIHASILKYIEKHEYNSETELKLLSYVERANEGPFMRMKLKRQESTTEAKKRRQEKALADVKVLLEDMVDQVEVIADKEPSKEVPPKDPEPQAKSSESSSTPSSSSSSDDDSSESSTGEDSTQPPPQPLQPTSYRLSVFQDMLRESELRQLRLAEAARIAEEKKKLEGVGDENEVEFLCEKPASSPVTEEGLHFSQVKYGKIIARCVVAMQECIARFPAHHKSYFRISYTYATFGKAHLKISRDWLLGNGTMAKKKILGLFGDRKPSNFFNGIWRNPVDDIDRPGSFPYHMSKTVQNLLEVLNVLNDHEMLAEIGIHLAKVPDSDKKYLRNAEREDFSKEALTRSVAAAKRLVTDNASTTQEQALGVYSSYLKIQKSTLTPKDNNGFVPVLMSAYEKHIVGKGIPLESVTIDFVLKYFQHLAWASKLKSAQKSKSRQGSAASRKDVPMDIVAMGTGTDPGKKIGTKRLSVVEEVARGLRGTGPQVPNMVPKPDLIPLPQLSPANTVLSSTSSTSTLGRAAGGTSASTGVRKKAPSSSPAPLSTSGDMLPRGSRELPNLLSIPTSHEEYLRQLGIIYEHVPQITIVPAPITPTKPRLSTSTAEEFILPDLSESIAAPWPGGSSGMHSPASSSSSTTTTSRLEKEKARRYKQYTAQALEAKLMFERTKAMCGQNYEPPNQSLFTTTPTPMDTSILSNLSKYFMAPLRQTEMISKFQLSPNTVPTPPPTTPRRSETESLSSIQSLIQANEQHQLKKKTSAILSPGSIVLEGETVAVYGYSDPLTASAVPVQATTSLPPTIKKVVSVTTADTRKRTRSGTRPSSAKRPLSGNEGKQKPVARKRTGGARPTPTESRYRSPPAALPLSTISTYNTSPFKAQATMVSNSGHFVKGHSGGTLGPRRTSSPPAAHAANKTPPHAGSSSGGLLEIIDLTTKTPPKARPPSNGNTGGLVKVSEMSGSLGVPGRNPTPAVKRPLPQMIALPTPTTATGPSGLESQPCHSLPPKKKLAMRKLDSPSSPQNPPPPLPPPLLDLPEIITID